MITIPAYFDGNAVRTLEDYKFEKGQRLTISVQERADENEEKRRAFEDIFGMLSHEEAEEMRAQSGLHFRGL